MIKDRKLPPDAVKKVPLLGERLRETDSVEALFFFGSLVRGALKPLSDLDFAVLLDKNLKGSELLERQIDIEGIVSQTLSTDEFDLVILNTAPLRFAYRILKDGRLVFVRDREQLIDFRERVVKLYLDFSHYRQSFDEVFRQGIGLGG